MSDQRGHEMWQELAAGYALHALEPADAERFSHHVAACRNCSALLGEYKLVAAQLGSLADSEADEPPSWQRLRTHIVGPAAGATPLEVARRRRSSRLLAAAAAAIVLAGAGVAAWQATRGSGRSATTALPTCHQPVGCHVITLRTPSDAIPAAVVVNGDLAAVYPLKLARPAADSTYVLWQMPRDGSPVAVSEFRDTTRQTAASTLRSGYADTAAFAISVESAGVPPSRPTHVLAVGNTH